MKNKGLIITTIIFGLATAGFVIYVCCDSNLKKERAIRTEQYAYEKALNGRSEVAYYEYLIKFPDGKHAKDIERRRERLLEKREKEAFDDAKKRDTETAWKDFLTRHPNGKYASDARRNLQEVQERAKWLDNSLSNGSQPYSKWYGRNRSCEGRGCSEITVCAPSNSDVVVMIKNSNDKVVRHAYICAGRSYTFEVPNGTYQPYYYYGKGWYPNKEMAKGMKGGFLQNEQRSYSKPESLYHEALTISLQLTSHGNLHTHPCSESDMF